MADEELSNFHLGQDDALRTLGMFEERSSRGVRRPALSEAAQERIIKRSVRKDLAQELGIELEGAGAELAEWSTRELERVLERAGRNWWGSQVGVGVEGDR
mmetsp:Transcript_53804/g.128243  ORF Transcript_53804/g.128243 Transcript_53804/m.128243 type:complete len:101 (-) Transcript_53804:74-376(-)